MPPSDFANANVDEIVEQLTTDEAILLTAGVGFWHTHAVPRLGIPAIKVSATISSVVDLTFHLQVSDGPNGTYYLVAFRLVLNDMQVSEETISS